VQVRQAGGKVIYDHVLQPGESWIVPSDVGTVTLTTGNAGGLTLAADGAVTPVLGRVGAVRRAVPLNAQAIHDGSIVDTAPATPGSAVYPQKPAHAAPAAAAPHRDNDATADSLNARQLQGTAPH
jgi:cytoskeleton protein RodZ